MSGFHLQSRSSRHRTSAGTDVSREETAAARRARRKRAKMKRKPAQPRTRHDVTASRPAMHPRVFAAMYFSFHTFCAVKTCRRTHRCTGGINPPCFYTFRWHVSEREKMIFRATIKALSEGAGGARAIAAGEAEGARYDALEAREAARVAEHAAARGAGPAAPSSSPQTVAPRAPPSAPRMRPL
jgi:hypothetical protein